MLKSKKLLIGAVLAGAVCVVWTGAILAFLFLEPSVAQWTAIVTVCAVVSEIALWAAVALFTALDRFRMLRFGKRDQQPRRR
jgi:hypothetical protein